MFLTPSDITRLTGKKRSSAQVVWLRSKGYRIEVNGLGEPILSVAEATRKLAGGSRTKNEEPDWAALHGPNA
jgi:hypothetical protein